MLTHEIRLRDAQIRGRDLTILAVPFDEPAPVLDPDGEPLLEQFARGAFAHLTSTPNRTALRYEHQQEGPPYAVGQMLREDPAGLVGQWRVADSPDGQRLLALVADQQVLGASIGFVPGDRRGDNQWIDGVLTRRYVKQLPEVSLTAAPAYQAAKVLELRSGRATVDERDRERARWRLRALWLR